MVNDPVKDYTLWKSFKDGSNDAFYRLYDQYANVLYRFGLHFTKDKAYIQDCIHDLFLDLYKYRSKLSMTDNIRFYLVRSLRRKLHQGLSKTVSFSEWGNQVKSDEFQEMAFEESVIATETEEENERALKKALEKLTYKQREALSLKFEQNLTYPEIAEILDVSVESTRTAIYRALKILRKSIQDDKSSIQLLFFLTSRSV
jgi:RNA polymerase sigma factor (sigma-70 family)